MALPACLFFTSLNIAWSSWYRFHFLDKASCYIPRGRSALLSLCNYVWSMYVCLCCVHVRVCMKIRRKELWCCSPQSPSNGWCSCSTSFPKCLSPFWPIWAPAAQLDGSQLASLPLWFVSYTLGEHELTRHLQEATLNLCVCVRVCVSCRVVCHLRMHVVSGSGWAVKAVIAKASASIVTIKTYLKNTFLLSDAKSYSFMHCYITLLY